MAIKRVFSAGGIVLIKSTKSTRGKNVFGEPKRGSTKRIEVLLTQHSGHKGWEFPKGHIEIGESSQDAAVREVEEESGVKAEILEKAGDCEYFYFENKERVLKKITYYFMKYVGEGEASTAFEVMNLEWIPVDEVLEKLTYKSTKDLWENEGGRVEELASKL